MISKLWRIAQHEYRRNVFKRSFILALLSVPLMIVLNVGVGFFMASREVNNTPVGYVDHAGLLAEPVPAPVTGSANRVELIPFDSEAAARTALEAGEIQAYYVVAAHYFSTRHVELFYLEAPGNNATRQFYDFIQINLLASRSSLGADVARRAALLGDQVTVRSLDGSRHVPSGGPTFGIIMPLLIGFAFVFLLLMNSGYLMQAVADEKENRTMEVVATSASPTQLIGGKVLGVVAVSLTQLVVWTLTSILAIAVAHHLGIDWLQDLSLDWGTVLAAAGLAIPAYVMACALMAAAGAMIVSANESQAAGMPFAVLHLAPLYLAWAIVMTPNALLPTILSFLPFTALLAVTLRNIFTAVPFWQVAASIAIQTACAIGAIWLAGRALRLGMLRYGRRLRLRELLRARSP
jgi:ABC-2 type transport system permease protein